MWFDCANSTCTQRFHLPLAAVDADALPKLALYGLLETFNPPSVHEPWAKEWHNHWSTLHRDYDLPALILPDGTMTWAKGRGFHRDNDKPAMIGADGTRTWYWYGEIHRNFGPAIIHPDGSEEFWDHGHQLLKGKYAL